MIAVTFHTGGKYGPMAELLAKSARRVGLTLDIAVLNDLGTWVANVNRKAWCILRAMQSFGQDILWVDVDSEFLDFPSDIFRMDAASDPAPDARMFYHGGFLWGSTMLFRNSPMGRDLVEQWAAQCELTPQYSSDSNLAEVIRRNTGRWLLGNMPQSCLECASPGEWGLKPSGHVAIRHYGVASDRERGGSINWEARNVLLGSPW